MFKLSEILFLIAIVLALLVVACQGIGKAIHFQAKQTASEIRKAGR